MKILSKALSFHGYLPEEIHISTASEGRTLRYRMKLMNEIDKWCDQSDYLQMLIRYIGNGTILRIDHSKSWNFRPNSGRCSILGPHQWVKRLKAASWVLAEASKTFALSFDSLKWLMLQRVGSRQHLLM